MNLLSSLPSVIDVPIIRKFKPQWLSMGHKSRAGLKKKLLHPSPRTAAESELLHRARTESRQQRRTAAFHMALVDISVKYPGESRKTRRAMARVRSKRNG